MTGLRRRYGIVYWLTAIGLSGVGSLPAQESVEYPGTPPGEARASVREETMVLGNDAITCRWSVRDGRLRPVSITNGQSGTVLLLQDSECFQLVLADGRVVKASDMPIKGGADIQRLEPEPGTTRLGAQHGGRQIRIDLAVPGQDFGVQWRAELRDGSNYVRQFLSFIGLRAETGLQGITLVHVTTAAARPAGIVDGSPLVAGDTFFAFEHPLSKMQVADANRPAFQCSLPRGLPLHLRRREPYSAVIGVVPPGQLRRGFLYYLERERARPYRPFLHYNSWYDIGYGAEKILEPDALKVIDQFGKELTERRKVVMDSFVWDDGWDDPASLWQFHEGFPTGFASLQKAAARYHAGIGAWLSPWGGYGQPKEERMKYGRQEGFETNSRGFSMAGPRYYERFRQACMGMIRDYRLNYFKFDGISSGGAPTGAQAEFAADVDALLRLIAELREAQPDLFINVTTGTWSSPYWLWYADSTWRSGADWDMCGWGSKRQRQITYRDAQTWQNVVRRAPLYPLNSLMTQGVMFANHGLPDEPDGMVADIRTFFASGTNCQELYITPSLLDAKSWDALAEAARWSRENADVLVDTHWVGGDPAKGEVYGWASWSRRKGILALRNPKDEPGQISIDIGNAFELPQGTARVYSLKSPWKDDAAKAEITLFTGKYHTFKLEPFEVLVFDAMPQ